MAEYENYFGEKYRNAPQEQFKQDEYFQDVKNKRLDPDLDRVIPGIKGIKEKNKRYYPIAYGSDQVDMLEEFYKDRITRDENREKVLDYYVTGKRTAAKAARYQQLGTDAEGQTTAYAKKHKNHWGWVRRKSARNAQACFAAADGLIEKYHLQKEAYEKYSVTEEILQKRLEGSLYAAQTKSQSKEHETYLQCKAKLKTNIILRDQAQRTIQELENQEEQYTDEIAILRSKLSSFNLEINTVKEEMRTNLPSSQKMWLDKNKTVIDQKAETFKENGDRKETARLRAVWELLGGLGEKYNYPKRICYLDPKDKPVNYAEYVKQQQNEEIEGRNQSELAGYKKEKEEDRTRNGFWAQNRLEGNIVLKTEKEAIDRWLNYPIPTPEQIEGEKGLLGFFKKDMAGFYQNVVCFPEEIEKRKSVIYFAAECWSNEETKAIGDKIDAMKKLRTLFLSELYMVYGIDHEGKISKQIEEGSQWKDVKTGLWGDYRGSYFDWRDSNNTLIASQKKKANQEEREKAEEEKKKKEEEKKKAEELARKKAEEEEVELERKREEEEKKKKEKEEELARKKAEEKKKAEEEAREKLAPYVKEFNKRRAENEAKRKLLEEEKKAEDAALVEIQKEAQKETEKEVVETFKKEVKEQARKEFKKKLMTPDSLEVCKGQNDEFDEIDYDCYQKLMLATVQLRDPELTQPEITEIKWEIKGLNEDEKPLLAAVLKRPSLQALDLADTSLKRKSKKEKNVEEDQKNEIKSKSFEEIKGEYIKENKERYIKLYKKRYKKVYVAQYKKEIQKVTEDANHAEEERQKEHLGQLPAALIPILYDVRYDEKGNVLKEDVEKFKKNKELVASWKEEENREELIKTRLQTVLDETDLPTMEQLRNGWVEQMIKKNPSSLVKVVTLVQKMEDWKKEYKDAFQYQEQESESFDRKRSIKTKCVQNLALYINTYLRMKHGIEIMRIGSAENGFRPVVAGKEDENSYVARYDLLEKTMVEYDDNRYQYEHLEAEKEKADQFLFAEDLGHDATLFREVFVENIKYLKQSDDKTGEENGKKLKYYQKVPKRQNILAPLLAHPKQADTKWHMSEEARGEIKKKNDKYAKLWKSKIENGLTKKKSKEQEARFEQDSIELLTSINQDLPHFLDDVTLPSCEELENGWIERQLRRNPGGLVEMLSKARAYPELKKVLQSDAILKKDRKKENVPGGQSIIKNVEGSEEFVRKFKPLQALSDYILLYLRNKYKIDLTDGAYLGQGEETSAEKNRTKKEEKPLGETLETYKNSISTMEQTHKLEPQDRYKNIITAQMKYFSEEKGRLSKQLKHASREKLLRKAMDEKQLENILQEMDGNKIDKEKEKVNDFYKTVLLVGLHNVHFFSKGKVLETEYKKKEENQKWKDAFENMDMVTCGQEIAEKLPDLLKDYELPSPAELKKGWIEKQLESNPLQLVEMMLRIDRIRMLGNPKFDEGDPKTEVDLKRQQVANKLRKSLEKKEETKNKYEACCGLVSYVEKYMEHKYGVCILNGDQLTACILPKWQIESDEKGDAKTLNDYAIHRRKALIASAVGS